MCLDIKYNVNINNYFLFLLQAERKRIENLGGCVMNWGGTWRVNGQLAVSRAIGNYIIKL